MPLNRILRTLPAVLLPLLLACACTDNWYEHYESGTGRPPDYSLLGYIRSNPDLSVFLQMLEKTGYDSVISASQTYTVWAPDNAALEGIDQNDLALLEEIIRNHIARGNHPTSGIESEPVKMLNGKNIVFARGSSGFTFGNVDLIQPNQITLNGQVHVLDGYVPYLNNLWEYIGRTENLDSLGSFLYGLNRWIFDPVNSVEIGFDTAGNVIYDSVFVYSNPVFQKLGYLDLEDSIYTAILPDNTAWEEAYGRVGPYYNVPEIFGGSERMRLQIQLAIVQDMVFREQVTDPGAFSYLVSTGGNVFHSPAGLFAGTVQKELSNGIAYVTDLMPFTDTSSWFKPIRVEAEVLEGRENANSLIYVLSGLGKGLDISEDDYIKVDPTGISNIAQPSVTFSIPNTLSATYDIYCVFVPASITDTSNLRPGKARFQLTYVSTTTGRTRRLTVTPDDNVTDPSGLTKMLVTRFHFDFANVIDEDFPDVGVRLQVTNDVTIEEETAGDFTRTMRIDCVILEPVLE